MKAWMWVAAAALVGGLLSEARPAAAQTTLGGFTFNNTQFGDTVTAYDGGTAFNSRWLNSVNANPGLTAALTGAHFDTGVANILLSESYTIGYASAIANLSGADLGVVVARFSADPVVLEVSTDGVSFSAPITYASTTAVSADTLKSYYYGGTGTRFNNIQLFVHGIDLSDFGVSSIRAVRVTTAAVDLNHGNLDLIRIAGLNPFEETPAAVPEPGAALLFLPALAALGFLRRLGAA